MLIRPRRSFVVALLAASLSACASDDVTGAPGLAVAGTFTVDARTNWQYVSFADSALVTPTPSATESGAWDLAFYGTTITLNGGQAGPGGIAAACICQNVSATGAEVLAMTPASELADFEAVTSVPAGLTWISDALTPAIAGWYTGTGAAAEADTSKSWLVRGADSVSYAVVRVRALSGATATSAGKVTLEYAVQPNAASPLGASRTLEVDLTTPGAKYVDLDLGVLTTAAAWDLRLDGFTIRVNGGISGPGKGAAAIGETEFRLATTAATQSNAYRTDVYAGIFDTARYYRYNILGDHRVSPSFDVYLIRRGTSTYKLQIIGYYGSTGTARQISIRWQRLDA